MVLNSIKFIQRSIFMIYVGIDVAKDKHDCFITNSDMVKIPLSHFVKLQGLLSALICLRNL